MAVVILLIKNEDAMVKQNVQNNPKIVYCCARKCTGSIHDRCVTQREKLPSQMKTRITKMNVQTEIILL